MKFKFLDILLYVLLFVFVAAFPIDLIPVSEVYKTTILIGLRLLLVAYYLYVIIKNKIKIFGVANFTMILLCVPFGIACFSNMIAANIDGACVPSNMGADLLATKIVLCFLIAITEEIIFRLFIHNSLTNCGSFKRILGSAGIFAVMHLINLVNISGVDGLVTVLVQVVYDFGLGLLLGFLYEFSHSISACIILHFGFNLCNQVLVQYYGFQSSQLCFYLTAIIIAAVLILYTGSIYLFYVKKTDRYFRQ